MSVDSLQLDFTSPGAIPPDPLEEIQNIIDEMQIKMQTLAALLENDQVKDTVGWKLLAMFYLVTERADNLSKIEKLYQKITGAPLSANLEQEYTQWFGVKNTQQSVVFEIPKKITAEALPENAIIRHGCHASNHILLDFSNVQEIDSSGLKKLAKLFTGIPNNHTGLELKQIERFIAHLQDKAEKAGTGTPLIWEVLFAYERFRNNKEAFEEKAIKFAVLFGISPPSWE